MFSRRTRWDLAPNALAREAEARRGRYLDLTETNPTRAGLSIPDEALRALVAPGGSARYEPDPRGLLSARAAIAADCAARGLAVEPDRIVLSASSSESYAWLFKLLCDPGDVVLVPRPGYPLFEFLAGLESVETVTFDTRWDGDAWRIDFESLERAVSPRVRAIVIVHPANPTGAFVTRDEAARLDALAAARGLAIVADEVFLDYGLPRHESERAESFAAHDRAALTFVLNGLSKSLGLPQLKLGWTIVRGPEALRRDALARLEVVADTYLSVATPVQLALPALLSRRGEVQHAIRGRVAENLDAARTACAGSALSLLEPEGGWALVLRVPRVRSDEEWALSLLRDHGVLVQPGYFFDFETGGHLVASLIAGCELFREGIERIRDAVR